MNSKIHLLIIAAVVSYSSCVKDNILEGRHLSVITAELPLIFGLERDTKGNVIGYNQIGYYLIDWLSNRLKFTYELNVQEFKFGEKINGSYDGLIGYIQRRESDVAVADFSRPWAVLDFEIIIPFPKEQSKSWAALKPFLPHVIGLFKLDK